MALNTWVPGGSGTYWGYGSYVADMGPYIGPFPLMAPAVLEEGETDFALVLPNPANPDDPTTVADNTYETDIFYAYRYADYYHPEITYENYFNDHQVYTSGPRTFPTAFESGMHLYVVVYPSGAPPKPPSFYVPRAYSQFGNAATITVPGGYSDWQPGSVAEYPAQENRLGARNEMQAGGSKHLNRGSLNLPTPETSEPYPFPALDLRTWEPDILAQIAAAVAAEQTPSGGTGFAALGGLTELKTDVYILGSHGSDWEVDLDGRQRPYQWIARDVPDYPNLSGFDVGVNPNPANYDPYLNEHPKAGVVWRDVDNYLINPSAFLEFWYSTPGDVFDFVWTGDIYVKAGDWVEPSDTYVDVSAMTHASNFTLTTTVDALAFTGSAVMDPTPLALSTLIPANTTILSIISQPSFLTGGPSPIRDIPEDDATYSDHGGAHAAITDRVATISYDKHNPRFRYWRPNRIVPAPTSNPTALRLAQRSDGLGIVPTIRLTAGQHARNAPRVGGKNTYQ